MEGSLSQSPTRAARAPLSGLGKLTVGCLAGVTALLAYAQVVIGGSFDLVASAIALVPLIAAGVVLVGWRWAPLLGTLVFGLLLALLAMMGGEIAFILAHPGGAMFGFMIVAIAVLAVGLVGSACAAAQNYRGHPAGTWRALPRGAAALLLIAGMVVGAVAVGAIPPGGCAPKPPSPISRQQTADPMGRLFVWR